MKLGQGATESGVADAPGQSSSSPSRHPGAGLGLRGMLATAIGGLGLLAAGITAVALGAQADRRLRADIGAEFGSAAERLADLLDRGLFERLREIRIVASLPLMRDAGASPNEQRHLLREVQRSYPDYAILLLIDDAGTIRVTSSGVLEGAKVGHRDYFVAGQKAPFLGDVHEGRLMSPLLGRPAHDPARFVDLAAPVTGEGGASAGVLAAHLYWEWAIALARDALVPLRQRHPEAQALILDKEGRVILGEAGEAAVDLARLAPKLRKGRGGSVVMQDNGSRSLVGFAPTRGHRDAASLGWTVLVRGDAKVAFAPVQRLRLQILGWGTLGALVAAGLGWWLAGLVARPMQRLSDAALQLRNDPQHPLPSGGRLREASLLAESLGALHASLRRREQDLADGEGRLRAVLEQMPVGVVLAEMPNGRLVFRNARAAEILGRPLELDAPLPMQTAFSALRRDGLPYEAEDMPIARALRLGESVVAEPMLYRRGDGAMVALEMSAAPVRSGSGQTLMVVCTFHDVTGARLAAEQHRVLAREVDHRAKNALAVVQAALRMTRADSTEAFVQAVEGRVSALARAQIRLAEAEWRGADLRLVLEGELGALLNEVQGGSVRMHGPPLTLTVEAVQPLSLVVHELATNAAQHGALSTAEGRVLLQWEAVEGAEQDMLHFRWIELDGPVLNGPPARRGFGARVIETTLRQQLGGMVRWEWRAAGLCCDLMVPTRRAVARILTD
ncbi:HWE histidine kinase domain-containing protein [Pseudoroseomonas globiformis]|uniref:histidine kinase n=1 Tax=Teichococcus globiformis TaxID=2307229 RepID=A0ABV7G286_9PROT